jgi:hypothetical protein
MFALSEKLIESSLILNNIYECTVTTTMLKLDNPVLLNYLCELPFDSFLVFIKSQNTNELINLFNVCDFLNIPKFLKTIGREIAERMNKMSKESITGENLVTSNSSLERIL